jgi:hypothetical protein
MADPYARLLELAQQSRAIVVTGDWEGLETLTAEQEALRAGLPARPPSAARAQLEEAGRVAAETTRIIERGLEAVQTELLLLGRGRRALASYGGPEMPVAALDWHG